MIPPFDYNYVLPPYIGDNPAQRTAQSPYHTDIMDLCKHFGTTRHRVDILKGFIRFRLKAYTHGIFNTIQRINGTMVIFNFRECGENLGTRPLGKRVRGSLQPLIEQNDCVVLDFTGVNVVSNSFADECIAKLLLVMSLTELKSRTHSVV